MTTHPSPSGPNDMRRRSLLKAAAWGVPAVTIASAAPAFAASTTPVCEIPTNWAAQMAFTQPTAAFTTTNAGDPSFRASDVADVSSQLVVTNTGGYTFGAGELQGIVGFAFPFSAGGPNTFDPAREAYPEFIASSIGAGWAITYTKAPYSNRLGFETYMMFTWVLPLGVGESTTPLVVTAKANPDNDWQPGRTHEPPADSAGTHAWLGSSIGWCIEAEKCDQYTALDPVDGSGYRYTDHWWVQVNA